MTVFEEAAYLSNRRWAEALPDEWPEVNFSAAHQRKMNALFDKMRGGRYHRFTRRVTAALVAAALLASLTVTAFAVPASREYIISRFRDHSAYAVVNAEQSAVGPMTVGYVPEGFALVKDIYDGGVSLQEYKYGTRWFSVSKHPLNTEINFDTEFYEKEELYYQGRTVVHSINKTSEGYIWNDGRAVFLLATNLPKEEALKIIETVA